MTTQDLVARAAQGRNLKTIGDIAFNADVEPLKRRADAAAAIRAYIEEAATSDFLVLSKDGKPPAGLGDLLNVYFERERLTTETMRFILSLHGIWREEAMRSLALRFGAVARGRNGAAPQAVRVAAQALIRTGTAIERRLAAQIVAGGKSPAPKASPGRKVAARGSVTRRSKAGANT